MLADSDTAVLLRTIRQVNSPFSWFASDWPLHNHFYRPVPTLTFELDSRLYGNNAAGYGLTNALLAIICVLALFWFLRELTDKPVIATSAAVLFALWTGGGFYGYAADLAGYGCWAALLLTLWNAGKALISPSKVRGEKGESSGKKAPEPDPSGFEVEAAESSPLPSREKERSPLIWKSAKASVAAALLLCYASTELRGEAISNVSQISGRMITWLPSRTASVMAFFALLALAAYARYERVSAERKAKDPAPTDPPATKSTKPAVQVRMPWLWASVAVLASALALASYEQAIMLPAALLGTAVAMKLQGFRVRWGWQVPFWLLLVAYLVLRKELLPSGVSTYQHQQLRFGPAVRDSVLSYVLPNWAMFWQSVQSLGVGIGVLLTADIYLGAFGFASNLYALFAAKKQLALALTGWSLSILTFLPMAFLKPFAWYSFWPMSFRALFAVTICWIGIERLITAVSPPTLQAPPRPDPAPGSLPRR
jgi:hypothetical protein